MSRIERKQLAACLRGLDPELWETLLHHVPEQEADELRALQRGEEHLELAVDGSPAPIVPAQERPHEDALDNDPLDPVEQILQATDPSWLGRILAEEHPQIATVALVQLPRGLAATVLSLFPEAIRADVLRRMAELESPDVEALADLRRELTNLIAREIHLPKDGQRAWECVTAVLSAADPAARKSLWSSLLQAFPQLAPSPETKETANPRLPPRGETSPPPRQGLAVLSQLKQPELLRLIDMFGEPEFALVVASGDAEVWDQVLRRLPQAMGRRLERGLNRVGPVDLLEVESMRSALIRVANLPRETEMELTPHDGIP